MKEFLWMSRGMVLLALASWIQAQGLLPPRMEESSAARDTIKPLLIGDRVPEALSGIDENGKRRTLLSFKSPLDVLVVTFLSTHCQANKSLWPNFRKFYGAYKGWKVAFVAVGQTSETAQSEVSTVLWYEKLPWPVLRDSPPAIASTLKVTGLPEIMIIDEIGILRYRGPLAKASAALETLIAHMEAVQQPEPPMTGACPLP